MGGKYNGVNVTIWRDDVITELFVLFIFSTFGHLLGLDKIM